MSREDIKVGGTRATYNFNSHDEVVAGFAPRHYGFYLFHQYHLPRLADTLHL